MDIVKGTTGRINFTAYSYWSGNPATSTPANLTGSTTNAYFKNRDGDADAAAVLTKTGAISDAINGKGYIALTAAETVALSQSRLVYEIVTKLSDGSYTRTGVLVLNLLPNVGKTLF